MTLGRFLLPALALAVTLAACASGPGPRGGPGGGGDRQGRDGGSGFDRATALLERGDAETAHTGFLCIARQGPGYEIAMHSAGLASLAMANGEGLDGRIADGLRDRGYLELISAANAGWPAAQAELAMRFSERGDDSGRQRAAYWLAVLDNNVRDQSLGLQRIPAARRAAMEADIGSGYLAAGAAEAANFRNQPLERVDTEMSCQPWLAQARNPQAGGRQRPEGGRGGGRGRGGGGRGPGG